MLTQDQPNMRRGLLLAGLGVTAVGVGIVWQQRASASYPRGEPVGVDVGNLPAGQLLTLDWLGKPVWVLRRTSQQLQALAAHEPQLTDADSLQSLQPPGCRNRHRSLNPDIFVAIGLCTHLGCAPALQADAGFLCPCHASRYDLAGRVFKAGPALANLVVPAYRFKTLQRLVVGVEA